MDLASFTLKRYRANFSLIAHEMLDHNLVESEFVGPFRALGCDPWMTEEEIRYAEHWGTINLGWPARYPGIFRELISRLLTSGQSRN